MNRMAKSPNNYASTLCRACCDFLRVTMGLPIGRCPLFQIIQWKPLSTSIEGLDEIASGGFPKSRPILSCGSAGCGKTLFGIQFLVTGIIDFRGFLFSVIASLFYTPRSV